MAEHDFRKCVGSVVGAAFGDALGWPHEQRASAVRDTPGRLGFYNWEKRSGGRFQPHTEQIAAGSYSDDTQLLLAVARARLSGGRWWEKLATVELPFWTMYERGGGGATLRAARAHLKGIFPWESSQAERTKYFNAGGNGVAMRILPHVIVGDDFPDVAKAVLADGVITHGHPRALVGALCYAFGLSQAFRSRGTLPYGGLLRECIDGIDEWARLPDISEYWPTWHSSAESIEGFSLDWDGAVFELYEALKLALRGLDAGALANDDEILERLGCFNRKVNGAGTVAAAASLFLVSKHAASPMEAVSRAALAEGADTDTIASMCGGLAGAFAGVEWFGSRFSGVQDLLYLDTIGNLLARHDRNSPYDPYRGPFDTKAADRLLNELRQGRAVIDLPIGGDVQVSVHDGVSPTGRNVTAQSWKLESPEGQTFYIKKVVKGGTKVPAREQPIRDQPRLPALDYSSPSSVSRVTILVRDLPRAKDFYVQCLNLRATDETPRMLRLGPSLWLRQAEDKELVGGASLYIDVLDLEACYRKVRETPALRVSKITTKGGKAAFACQDFDGHRLEVFQS